MFKNTNVLILALAIVLIMSIFLNIFFVASLYKRGQSASSGQFMPEQLHPSLPENKVKNINSFEECAKAGYPVMQTYPRQCKLPDGRNFTEPVDQNQR